MNSQALGVILMIASVTVMVGMSATVKSIEGLPLGEIVFFRSLFGVLPVLLVIAVSGQFQALKTRRLGTHLSRGLFSVGTTACTFYGLRILPMAESTAIGYTTPIIVVVLAALIFKERVSRVRALCVTAGFVGVLVILSPHMGGIAVGSESAMGAMVNFVGALLAAASAMFTRKLLDTESPLTIALYLSLSACLYALASAPFGWLVPNATQLLMLLAAGIAGGLGQFLLAASYRRGELSLLSPISYSSIMVSTLVGYLLFNDVPGIEVLIGSLILIIAGIVLVLDGNRRANETPMC